jgi:2-dehydro-3-deoxyphosphooctonate aldolase (KDO 8-P synthase)
MAKQLKEKYSMYNVNFIFKVSFDKANRTSLNSYRGVSFEEGIRILKKVKDEVRVPIITDIHESWQAKPVAEVADILQIPAFLCRQTDLLKAAAETGRILHVKKGQFTSADVMHKTKEKLIAFGNPNVILCERGNSFGYQDLVVDPRNLVWLKSSTNLVSMDITHCLQQPAQKMADGTVQSGGLRELIPYMGKMAVSLGVDGVFMEVHDRPDESFCDASTQWPLDKLDWLMEFIGIEKKKDYNFIKYHSLFRNPCGETNVIKKIIYKLIDIYDDLLIIDGGYYLGDWSSLILKYKSNNFKIRAYEVNKLTFNKNSILDNRLILLNYGLSDKEETLRLNLLNKTNESFTITDNITDATGEEIKLIRLDNNLKNINYSYLIIKLDIESYEYKVLTTLDGIIDKILIIQFEYHNIHKNNIPHLFEYLKLIKKYNMDLFVIGENELLKVDDDNVNFFDICIDNNLYPINKRPEYNGGSPDYNKIYLSKHMENFKPENINLIGIKRNILSLFKY